MKNSQLKSYQDLNSVNRKTNWKIWKMPISMMSTQLWHGKRLRNKLKMTGTTLKREYTMNTLSKRKFTTHKKLRTCNLKLSTNWWVLRHDKTWLPKEEMRSIPNGSKINLWVLVFIECQVESSSKMKRSKIELSWWCMTWNLHFWTAEFSTVHKWGRSKL